MTNAYGVPNFLPQRAAHPLWKSLGLAMVGLPSFVAAFGATIMSDRYAVIGMAPIFGLALVECGRRLVRSMEGLERAEDVDTRPWVRPAVYAVLIGSTAMLVYVFLRALKG